MKSIKIYLLPLILLIVLSSSSLAQSSLKKDSLKREKVFSKADSVLVEGYVTELDFIEQNYTEDNVEIGECNTRNYYGDEIYNEEPLPSRKRNAPFWDAVAVEVVADVIVNAVFIIAAFWQ